MGKVPTFGKNKHFYFQFILLSVVVESMSKSAFLSMLKSSSEKPKSKDQPNGKVCGLNKKSHACVELNLIRFKFPPWRDNEADVSSVSSSSSLSDSITKLTFWALVLRQSQWRFGSLTNRNAWFVTSFLNLTTPFALYQLKIASSWGNQTFCFIFDWKT